MTQTEALIVLVAELTGLIVLFLGAYGLVSLAARLSPRLREWMEDER